MGVPMQKSIRFFIRMLPVFLARVKPASHMAKPACMKKTSAAPNRTQMVLTELNSIVVSSHFCRFLPANGSAYKKAMEPSER